MPSPLSSRTPSRRQFLRTAAATFGTGLTASTAGCTTRNLFSGVNVHFRSQALESPPLGLVNTGTWLVAAGRAGDVVGMDRGDGEVQWEVDALEELSATPVSHDERVYVAGEAVVSVDSGTVRWRTSLPGEATALTVDSDSDVVVAGTEDGDIVAVNGDDSQFVDADDGDRLWETTLNDGGGARARVDALAASSGVVYAGSRDGAAVAYDAQTGEEQWRTDTVVSAVASTGGSTLLGRRDVSSVRDGDVWWSRPTPNNWTTEIASTGRWYVTGSQAEGNGYVQALSLHGDERWRHRLTGDGVALTPVVNGRLAVGVEGERPGVHQLTTDGDSAWFFETETSVVDVVYTGDWVWALTASGVVMALSQ